MQPPPEITQTFTADPSRFWTKVEKTGGCWVWRAARNPDSYGRFHLGPKVWQAHLLAWTLTRGPVPRGMCVLHRCDTPACVKPAHLFLGTKADNTADMMAKGRGPTGERQGRAKLTRAQVGAIRARYRSRQPGDTLRDLAAEYGVTFTNIWQIVHDKSWR